LIEVKNQARPHTQPSAHGPVRAERPGIAPDAANRHHSARRVTDAEDHPVKPAESPRAVALPQEPTPESLRAPIARLLVATRPPFLTITLVGALLGVASAWGDGAALSAWIAPVTVLLALTMHAAVNVLNDWCDHVNGTDEINVGRIYPFTGGSRFIQNGLMTPAAMRAFALALFAFTIAGGLLLVAKVGGGLLWFGIAGAAIGWAYSAPPLALNSRGFGELCVAASFWLLVAGADYVQRGAFSATPFLAGGAYALLTTNILYINQFPDRAADLAVGKHHWVARLAPDTARWGYVLILLGALAALVVPVALGALTPWVLLGLVAFVPAALAAKGLLEHADAPQHLAPSIKQTIAAAHLAAVLVAVGFLVAGRAG
jgi:1,4-dihydroxy-2-naphthoate octaprenyltransferase